GSAKAGKLTDWHGRKSKRPWCYTGRLYSSFAGISSTRRVSRSESARSMGRLPRESSGYREWPESDNSRKTAAVPHHVHPLRIELSNNSAILHVHPFCYPKWDGFRDSRPA